MVTLRWNAPVDLNQTNGLTYNLQVGTTPGGYDVLSPEADSRGLRRVAKPGIAARPIWKLVLPVGTYYWRVQAVDAALAGGAFSVEASFTVPAQAPRVLTLAATTNANGYPVLNGRANPNSLGTTAWFEYGLTNFEFQTAPQALGSGTQPMAVAATSGAQLSPGTYSYRLVASNSLGTTFGATCTFSLPYFNDRTVDLPAGYIHPIAVADCDNDGALDLVVQGYYGVSIYRNQNGVFTNLLASMTMSQSGAAWGDYDNDGDLDCLLTGRDDNWQRLTKLYRNDGGGQFTSIPIPLIGVYYATAAWADFDNDGRLDLLVSGADSWDRGVIQMCRNEGNDVFTVVPVPFPAVANGPVIACADYDNDGRVDVLLAGSVSGTRVCRLYHNDGDFTFSDSGQSFPGFENGAASWGDYDHDGRLDLLLNGKDDTNYIARVFHNSPGGFQELGLSLPGMLGGSAWMDYDNDGWLDILVRGSTDIYNSVGYVTRLYRNLGGGTFAESAIPLPLASDTSAGLWAADYDHDGDPDLMTQDGHLLRNEGRAVNAPPAAPGGLGATIDQSSATLAWQPGTDLNQAGGLTYNVRVGTTPGGQEIVAPMCVASTGQRLLPALGNAFVRTNFSLNYLKVGTYYWSVQTVDNLFVASAFAPEQSFTVAPHAPAIRFQTVSNIAAESALLNASVNPNARPTAAWFEYGLSTNYGSLTPSQNLGAGVEWAASDGLDHGLAARGAVSLPRGRLEQFWRDLRAGCGVRHAAVQRDGDRLHQWLPSVCGCGFRPRFPPRRRHVRPRFGLCHALAEQRRRGLYQSRGATARGRLCDRCRRL